MSTGLANWAQILGAFFTAVAAIAACITVYQARAESKLRAAFEYFRTVEERGVNVWPIDESVESEIIMAASSGNTLSPRGRALMAYLSAVEVFSNAALRGVVDRDVADDLMGGIGRHQAGLAAFLARYRRTNNDPLAFSCTEEYAALLASAEQARGSEA